MNFSRRVSQLERFHSASGDRLLVVVDVATCPVNADECVRLLDQRGKLSQSGCVVVNLTSKPDGLTDREWAQAREMA